MGCFATMHRQAGKARKKRDEERKKREIAFGRF